MLMFATKHTGLMEAIRRLRPKVQEKDERPLALIGPLRPTWESRVAATEIYFATSHSLRLVR